MTFLGRIRTIAKRVSRVTAFPGHPKQRKERGESSRAIAELTIDQTFALKSDEPSIVQHWRAREIGRALVHFNHGDYRKAIEAALRARLPAARIPENELSRGALGELRARRQLFRWVYKR